jgi:hypothetical protein
MEHDGNCSMENDASLFELMKRPTMWEVWGVQSFDRQMRQMKTFGYFLSCKGQSFLEGLLYRMPK